MSNSQQKSQPLRSQPQDLRESHLLGNTPGPANKGCPKLLLGHLIYEIVPSLFSHKIDWLM